MGVDIFFVISGFLITSIIIRELNEGKFSLPGFYQRRMRRILPALFVVLASSLAAGFFLAEPELLSNIAKSTVASSLFGSNIFFYFEIDYFRRKGELWPLIHTWSLGVEEQFYILFPLLLILICKYCKRLLFPLILVLLIVSLYFCAAMTEGNQSLTFYMIQFRAWELLVGSLLALNVIPVVRSTHWQNLLGITGLFLIVISVFFFHKHLDFPGIFALVPVIGSALIIWAGIGGNYPIGNVLSLKPLVFIGLISYSLYLWHWPVIVFAGYYNILELSNLQLFFVLLAILAISAVSWRYIETPFRNKPLNSISLPIYGYSACAIIALVAAGLVTINASGFPGRYDYDQSQYYVSDDPDWEYSGSCEWVYKRIRDGKDLCDIGAENAERTFLLWGDSFARAYFTSVDQSAKRSHVGGKIATQRACSPLLGIERRARAICGRFNDTVLKYIENHPEITTVILSARWTWMLGVKVRDMMDTKAKREPIEHIRTGLFRTVNRLKELGRTVYLIHPVPVAHKDVPTAHYVAYVTGRDVNTIVAPTYNAFSQENAATDEILKDIEAEGLAVTISPASYLCDSALCPVSNDLGLLYRDYDHLSNLGSALVSPAFDEIFELK